MCLLTYFPENVLPNAQHLRNGGTFNDDGHGWAIVANGSIIVSKTLDLDAAVSNFVATRKAFPEGPALFHSRLSTGGTIDTSNCHPFPVNGDNRTVIGHNGIFPKSVQPGKNDHRSDTRILAEDFLTQRQHLQFTTKRQRRALESWMGKFNKAVILTVDPKYPFNSIILNENMGIWDNGIWYSNDAYEGWTSRIYSIQPNGWGTGTQYSSLAEYARCNHCLSYGTVKKYSHFCSFCGMCNDCDMDGDSCICYIPTSLIKDDDSDRYVKWWEDAEKGETNILGYSVDHGSTEGGDLVDDSGIPVNLNISDEDLEAMINKALEGNKTDNVEECENDHNLTNNNTNL